VEIFFTLPIKEFSMFTDSSYYLSGGSVYLQKITDNNLLKVEFPISPAVEERALKLKCIRGIIKTEVDQTPLQREIDQNRVVGDQVVDSRLKSATIVLQCYSSNKSLLLDFLRGKQSVLTGSFTHSINLPANVGDTWVMDRAMDTITSGTDAEFFRVSGNLLTCIAPMTGTGVYSITGTVKNQVGVGLENSNSIARILIHARDIVNNVDRQVLIPYGTVAMDNLDFNLKESSEAMANIIIYPHFRDFDSTLISFL
jgi:hypothetical protein